MAVGTTNGWRYAWAGGQIVVWQAGPAIYTAVGEAASDEVLAVARSFPRPANPSNWKRVRRHLTAVMRAVSGG